MHTATASATPAVVTPDPHLQQQAQQRAQALQAAFEHIQHTRMAGVPVMHPGLQVAAVDFEPEADGAFALGVLVTPWFMNVMRLPLGTPEQPLAVGDKAVRHVGSHRMQFIGGLEPAIGACGRYEACSLFSPMGEFEDQAAALATAREVLLLLRTPPAPEDGAAPVAPAPAASGAATAPAAPTSPLPPASAAARPAEPVPARRGFLFGRSAAGR